ncbi:MAG: hypothetical protein AABY22_04585 [Nanoarchaeota archaeon]
MPKKKDKCYVVLDTRHRYLHGAFNYTEEGREKARELAKKLSIGKDKYIVDIK